MEAELFLTALNFIKEILTKWEKKCYYSRKLLPRSLRYDFNELWSLRKLLLNTSIKYRLERQAATFECVRVNKVHLLLSLHIVCLVASFLCLFFYIPYRLQCPLPPKILNMRIIVVQAQTVRCVNKILIWGVAVIFWFGSMIGPMDKLTSPSSDRCVVRDRSC